VSNSVAHTSFTSSAFKKKNAQKNGDGRGSFYMHKSFDKFDNRVRIDHVPPL
jgi:hypothetical protein